MHTKRDALGDRMKMYESVPKIALMKKTPVIVRIDGKAFHTFTRGFQKPFDEVFIKAMQETTKYLCENVQGCVLGYTQSDEITLVLCDYQTYDTAAYFDYEVQKLCSIIASMTTMKFNKEFYKQVNKFAMNLPDGVIEKLPEELEKLYLTYKNALNKGALFDARCYNVPVHEVVNTLIWRQQDATRNSIQMVAQYHFPHSSLQGLNCNQLQDKLYVEKRINWNDLSTVCKRGTCIIRKEFETPEGTKSEWIIDTEIPVFTQDREYVESRINFD